MSRVGFPMLLLVVAMAKASCRKANDPGPAVNRAETITGVLSVEASAGRPRKRPYSDTLTLRAAPVGAYGNHYPGPVP